jgi:uncharacterized phage protein (TIGR02218 family)
MSRVELYKFVRDTDEWTLTSSDTAVDYLGDTYEPAVIGHDNRVQRQELAKTNLKIKIDIESDLAVSLLGYFGNDIMSVTLFLQDSSGTETIWKGRYVSQKINNSHFTIVTESLFTTLKRPGLRAQYQKTCRHALYFSGCNLDKDNFDVSGTLTAISGEAYSVTEASSQPDGYYSGGMIEDPTDGSLRWIVDHVGQVLTLARTFEALSVSDTVNIYPGCDHIRTTCVDKFNNVLNYGGFPWIPSKNPMGGSSIV